MKKLNELNIVEAAEGLKKGDFTSVELTKACLDVIKEKNDEINAFITITEELALKQAEESDNRRQKNNPQGYLDGIPCAVKDNLNVKGVKTTAGSKILENFEAIDDAFVIKNLQEAGVVILGKANMDEFAMGGSTETSYFGRTKNPLDLERVPGGSSGGSAAAVAANMCIFAIGSDTGGSIRQPASYCGIVGLKPTYGTVSRNGLLAMSSSLDQIGPMTKTVEDAKIVFEAIALNDEGDSTMNTKIIQDYKQKNRVALLSQSLGDGVSKEVQEMANQSISEIKSMGYETTDLGLDILDASLPVYYVIMPVEVSANLGRYDGIKYGFRAKEAESLEDVYSNSRGEGFGTEAKRRLMLGTFASSEGYKDQYYKKAQKVRGKIISELNKVFEEVDFIISPTAPTPAFKAGEKEDPLAMYVQDIFTVTANIAGLPAISIPYGEEGGMPIGLHVMGKRGSDKQLLDFANKIKR